jgi:hypothetical protein
MPSPFIPDGYTKSTEIPACHAWDAITLTYRPMASTDFAAYLAKSKGLDDAGWCRLVHDLIAAKIVSWNIVGPDGGTIEVSSQNVGRLTHELVLKLWKIVSTQENDGDATKN